MREPRFLSPLQGEEGRIDFASLSEGVNPLPRLKHNYQRIEKLKRVLTQGREALYERVKASRRDRNLDALSTPGDAMDLAKSLVDAEINASIVERAAQQLAQIDSALARLDDGRYGICLECGEEIPIERLRAIPSTIYCVGCKDARQSPRSRGN
jgi:DnaK suppressor protein